MIRVQHNGEERLLDVSGLAHLGDVIEACATSDPRDVVTCVRVNGCEIPDDSLDRLESFPLEGVEQIDVETRPRRAVAISSLESAAEYAPALSEALFAAASHLRGGRIEQAGRLQAEASDALGVFTFAVTAAAEALGSDGEPLCGLEAALRPWLQELLEAHQQQDWVRVADYLEYEVAPLIDGCRQGIARVLRQVSDPGSEHGAH